MNQYKGSFEGLAERVAQAAGGACPVLLYHRQEQTWRADFTDFEVDVHEEIAAPERAVLELIAALGTASALDVDRYLAMGRELPPRILQVLEREQSVARSDAPRAATEARMVHEHAAEPGETRFVLTERGRTLLGSGARTVRRTVPLRLRFLERPLWFVEVEERRSTKRALIPESDLSAVPRPLLELDGHLRLPEDERLARCGVPAELPRVNGRLRGPRSGADHSLGRGKRLGIVVARLESGETNSFFRFGPRLKSVPALDPARVSPIGARSISDVLGSCGYSVGDSIEGVPSVRLARRELLHELGPGATPRARWLKLTRRGDEGELAVLVRLIPADMDAAKAAHIAWLGGRATDVGTKGLELVARDGWGELNAHWGLAWPMPEMDEIVDALWARRQLRRALCQHRMRADLVDAYAEES